MWQFVVLWVASMVISYLLAPKPQAPTPGDVKPGTTAEAGRPIPVLFGTRIVAQPNVVWWGDVGTKPIKASGGKK